MSNFAIIPWTDTYLNDAIFRSTDSAYINGLLLPYLDLKEEFEKSGHNIHTIDMYSDYNNVDFFLFFTLNWEEYHRIVKLGMSEKMVYCTAEPPSVYKYNSKQGYRILRHIFPYILSWNDEWVDDKNVFKRNMPYHFEDLREGNKKFKEKKLITSISGNKHSNFPGELYSEREHAIAFFEKEHPDEFEFYGTGWSSENHPCYKGKVDDKCVVFHDYRFSLCYENIEGLKGYISEKILDCLVSGIVPIYAGSSDIDKYIPDNCYIKLRDFSSYSQLYDFIHNISSEKYYDYLKNADIFLHSPSADYFSGARYAQYIMNAVKLEKKYKSSLFYYKLFKYIYLK